MINSYTDIKNMLNECLKVGINFNVSTSNINDMLNECANGNWNIAMTYISNSESEDSSDLKAIILLLESKYDA